MRVWQIPSFGIDSLELVERPTPQPGPGEVLVKIHAVSLNYRDLMMVKGSLQPQTEASAHPMLRRRWRSCGSRRGRTQWKSGDRVCGCFFQNWIDGPPTPAKIKGALGGDIDGMLAEYVLLKQTGLVRIPGSPQLRRSRHSPLRRTHRVECAHRWKRPGKFNRPGARHRRSLHFRASIREAERCARPRNFFKRRQAATRLFPRARQGSRLRRNIGVGPLGRGTDQRRRRRSRCRSRRRRHPAAFASRGKDGRSHCADRRTLRPRRTHSRSH